MSKVRLKTECIECEEPFTKLIEKEGVVVLTCPFCGAKSKVEFIDNSIKSVFKGVSKTFSLDEVIRLEK